MVADPCYASGVSNILTTPMADSRYIKQDGTSSATTGLIDIGNDIEGNEQVLCSEPTTATFQLVPLECITEACSTFCIDPPGTDPCVNYGAGPAFNYVSPDDCTLVGGSDECTTGFFLAEEEFTTYWISTCADATLTGFTPPNYDLQYLADNDVLPIDSTFDWTFGEDIKACFAAAYFGEPTGWIYPTVYLPGSDDCATFVYYIGLYTGMTVVLVDEDPDIFTYDPDTCSYSFTPDTNISVAVDAQANGDCLGADDWAESPTATSNSEIIPYRSFYLDSEGDQHSIAGPVRGSPIGQECSTIASPQITAAPISYEGVDYTALWDPDTMDPGVCNEGYQFVSAVNMTATWTFDTCSETITPIDIDTELNHNWNIGACLVRLITDEETYHQTLYLPSGSCNIWVAANNGTDYAIDVELDDLFIWDATNCEYNYQGLPDGYTFFTDTCTADCSSGSYTGVVPEVSGTSSFQTSYDWYITDTAVKFGTTDTTTQIVGDTVSITGPVTLTQPDSSFSMSFNNAVGSGYNYGVVSRAYGNVTNATDNDFLAYAGDYRWYFIDLTYAIDSGYFYGQLINCDFYSTEDFGVVGSSGLVVGQWLNARIMGGSGDLGELLSAVIYPYFTANYTGTVGTLHGLDILSEMESGGTGDVRDEIIGLNIADFTTSGWEELTAPVKLSLKVAGAAQFDQRLYLPLNEVSDTIDTAGQLSAATDEANNYKGDYLIWRSENNTYRLMGFYTKTLILPYPNSAQDILLQPFPYPITIVKIWATLSTADTSGSVTGGFDTCEPGDLTVCTSRISDFTVDDYENYNNELGSPVAISIDDYLKWHTTSTTGTLSDAYLTVVICYLTR